MISESPVPRPFETKWEFQGKHSGRTRAGAPALHIRCIMRSLLS
jgi:hypothetical protein